MANFFDGHCALAEEVDLTFEILGIHLLHRIHDRIYSLLKYNQTVTVL